jgi:CheY-like chemotaxis protein
MSQESPKQPLAGVQVLVIEDDADTRDLYSMALVSAGAEVRTAADARDAMRTILTWHPTVVVSDLGIPGLDGSALLREIRSVHLLRDIPAIAVSGRDDPRDREEAFAAGFHEYASKPLTPMELTAIIARRARPSA